MKVSQFLYTPTQGLNAFGTAQDGHTNPNLVLGFGAREILGDPERYAELKAKFPNAHILMASTSGEIAGTQVLDGTIAVTAVELEKTPIQVANVNISRFPDSFQAGVSLAQHLSLEGLAFVFLVSDGHLVNGSELVKGIHTVIPESIPVTGGLAGDGAKFEKTLVGMDHPPSEGNIVAVGFYGTSLVVGHGSRGGWDIFGPQRLVTRAKANVLYELDDRNALDLYKEYLGEYAKDLPASGLLFPLSLRDSSDADTEAVVRTILSIDEDAKSMTFAGDIPVGSYATLMKANFNKLIDGAQGAAANSFRAFDDMKPQLAILISCVGRKLVLGPRIEEEVEAAQEVFGPDVPITGFYSYGELSPFNPSSKCELHNQTMTITVLSEV
jgi:hypothetical protein